MKGISEGILSLVVLVTASCSNTSSANTESPGAEQMQITRASARAPTRGEASNFTGAVTVNSVFAATKYTRASAGTVTFEPGARSGWHSHPAGQTLIVTSGTGWVQQWGATKQEIKVGDVVWTPPGVKHWHGATRTEGLTHLAIQEHLDGKVVNWMEPVTEEQYGS
jgi:quercetin dioxygenase-like cupin family protein